MILFCVISTCGMTFDNMYVRIYSTHKKASLLYNKTINRTGLKGMKQALETMSERDLVDFVGASGFFVFSQ